MPMGYKLKAVKLGAEVEGLHLSEPVDDETVQQLKKDVYRYKLLIFRNQGELSGERQVEITQWFGEVETAGFELHPCSPDRRILRVSNDESEGFTGFGTSGFHVDGSFLERPNTHSIYHMIQAPTEGETVFVSLNSVYKGISRDKRKLWKRLAMRKDFCRIRGYQEEPGFVIHPLVYQHPVTKQKTMCFTLGKMSRFMMDMGTPRKKQLSKEETKEIISDINAEITRNNGELLYKHKWQTGDVIISDNLAVGHMAESSTQRSRSEIGLRVMHRTVTVGTFRPRDGHCNKSTDALSCAIS